MVFVRARKELRSETIMSRTFPVRFTRHQFERNGKANQVEMDNGGLMFNGSLLDTSSDPIWLLSSTGNQSPLPVIH